MTKLETSSRLGLYSRWRKLSLGFKILIAVILGVIAGIIFGENTQSVRPVGTLFIRMLMMGAIPLVFFNLVAGISSLPDTKSLGRIGGKIFLFYFSTTVIALIISLTMMGLIQPGEGMKLTEVAPDNLGEVPSIVNLLLEMVPNNIFLAFSEGKIPQIVVFAVFLSFAILLLPSKHKDPIVNMFGHAAQLLRKLVRLILVFAPIGIGALAASTVGQYGAKIFGPLAKFLGGIWLCQAIMVVIYIISLIVFARYSPIKFFKRTAPLYATTAATCSSMASLVVSLDIAEERMKLPRSIYSFTLTIGAQMNKNGTAIMLAAILLFTAQASQLDFPIASQITIVAVGLLLSLGSAGIPGGGLVIALIFVKAFNLPLEVAAIVGGIYQLIDMGGTTINCMGDMVGTVIVSQSEKKHMRERTEDENVELAASK